MPLYQYRCRECGYELEARQSFSEGPLQLCPHCGAEQGLFRVIQAAGVVFKGSGFYINDSKGSKRELTTPAKKDGETAAPAASTSSDAPAAPASTPAPASPSSSEKSTP
jgi:putative FmdB family regulatory protein